MLLLREDPLDCTGRRVEIGHIIAFPTRGKSDIKMNFGKVIDIYYKDIHPVAVVETTSHLKIKEDKRYHLHTLHLCVILPMSDKWYDHKFSV